MKEGPPSASQADHRGGSFSLPQNPGIGKVTGLGLLARPASRARLSANADIQGTRITWMLRYLPEPDLPPYARALVDRAIELSGYRHIAGEEIGPEGDFELWIAGGDQHAYKLHLKPSYRDHRVHLVVSGAYRVIRFWEAPPDQRYLAGARVGRCLPPEQHQELGELLADYPADTAMEISRELYRETGRRVTTLPVELRVEREIAEDLPEHRQRQTRYLRKRIEEFGPLSLAYMSRLAPRLVYRANTAMDVTFGEESADLADVQPGPLAPDADHSALGHRLRDHLRDVHESGHAGDRKLVDLWAEELGLRGWYSWRRQEDV